MTPMGFCMYNMRKKILLDKLVFIYFLLILVKKYVHIISILYLQEVNMKKLIYNRYLGELWLWMIFIEWIYNII